MTVHRNKSSIINLPSNLVPKYTSARHFPELGPQNRPGRKKWYVLAGFMLIALVVTVLYGYQASLDSRPLPKSTVTRQESDADTIHENFPSTLPFINSPTAVLQNYTGTLDEGEIHAIRKWVVTRPVAEVGEAYEAYFSASEWTVTLRQRTSEGRIFAAFNNSVNIRVAVNPSPNASDSIIEVEATKQ